MNKQTTTIGDHVNEIHDEMSSSSTAGVSPTMDLKPLLYLKVYLTHTKIREKARL